MQEIEKIDIAIEQLGDSLKAYFDGRYFSAIVLAGAAEPLLAGYLHKHGVEPEWKRARRVTKVIADGLRDGGFTDGEESTEESTEKSIGDMMNYAYNNSKHAGAKEHTIHFDPKAEAREIIDRARINFDALSSLEVFDLPDIPLLQEFAMKLVERAPSNESGDGEA